MTLGELLVRAADETQRRARVDWPSFMAWNLTLASLLCKAERMTSALASAGIKVDELRVALDDLWEDLNKHQ
jgi:hypothetical protein